VYFLCSDFDDTFAHRRIIQQNYTLLVNWLDSKFSGLVHKLFQEDVINRDEMDIINYEGISSNKNEKLLSILSRKTKEQFDKFLDALDNSGQRHVLDLITGRKGQLQRALFLLLARYVPNVAKEEYMRSV